MAEQTPINITIDEAALREQVRSALQDELTSMALKLHYAADALDPAVVGDLAEEQYNRGYHDGLAAAEKGADRG